MSIRVSYYVSNRIQVSQREPLKLVTVIAKPPRLTTAEVSIRLQLMVDKGPCEDQNLLMHIRRTSAVLLSSNTTSIASIDRMTCNHGVIDVRPHSPLFILQSEPRMGV